MQVLLIRSVAWGYVTAEDDQHRMENGCNIQEHLKKFKTEIESEINPELLAVVLLNNFF